MEKMRKSIWAKIAIFMLIIMLGTTAVISSVFVVSDLKRGVYDSTEAEFREKVATSIMENAAAAVSEEESALYNQAREVAREEGKTFVRGQDKYTDFIPESEADIYVKNWENYGFEILSGPGVVDGEPQIYVANNSELKTEENVKRSSTMWGGGSVPSYRIIVYLSADWQENNMNGIPPFLKGSAEAQLKAYENRLIPAATAGISFLLTIVFFIFLMLIIGHGGKGDRKLRIPLDLFGCISFFLVMVVGLRGSIGVSDFLGERLLYDMVLLAIATAGLGSVALSFICTAVIEVKEGTWWKATIIYRLFKFLTSLVRKATGKQETFAGPLKTVLGNRETFLKPLKQIPLVWKIAVVTGGLCLVNLALGLQAGSRWYSGGAGSIESFVWIGLMIGIFVWAVKAGLALKKLQEGAKALSEGDLNYKVDKAGMFLGLKTHAEDLNRIGEGMKIAVEEQTKSERFKAELITNVSHDIKTPLTSIINYVDLLKKEKLTNKKAKEYIEVLDRQSQRLKKLTIDIVDASKASTGNVTIDLAPCGIGVLMNQTMGEYEEKAKNAKINFVMSIPEEELTILADGRQLWRVFDNLLNNICKYSHEGTRAYISLAEKKGEAVITYRNTSKYELNITEDELMERFVRGDRTRHTEGSGLGLAIAKDLVELQDGKMDIVIDGDLFKIVVKFKLVK